MKALLLLIFFLPGKIVTYMPPINLCIGQDTVLYGGTKGLLLDNDNPDVLSVNAYDGVNVHAVGISEGTATVTYYQQMNGDSIFIFTGNVKACAK